MRHNARSDSPTDVWGPAPKEVRGGWLQGQWGCGVRCVGGGRVSLSLKPLLLKSSFISEHWAFDWNQQMCVGDKVIQPKRHQTQGGRPVRIPDPNPPPSPPASRTPKVFEPVFLQIEILRERVGTEGAENLSFPFLRGYFFYPMCLYSKYSEFCGEFKNV